MLYENISPGFKTVPFIFLVANLTLIDLFTFVSSYLVEYFDNSCGNASSPKSLIVISALVNFKGIEYSCSSVSIIFCASSIEIAKSIPSSSKCNSKGSFLYNFIVG